MKSTTKMMFAAAALTIVSGVASAQPLKATIPFSFRFGAKVYTAGTYSVDVQDGRKVFLYSRDTHTGAIALSMGATKPNREWLDKGEPVLQFTCGTRCELASIWAGGPTALAMPHHKLGRDEVATTRVVRLSRSNGD